MLLRAVKTDQARGKGLGLAYYGKGKVQADAWLLCGEAGIESVLSNRISSI